MATNGVAALDAYLDFLDTSDSVAEKDPQPTPRIDTVLHSYRQKTSSESGCDHHQGDYESRLVQLEKQLTTLLKKTKASPYRDGGQSSKESLRPISDPVLSSGEDEPQLMSSHSQPSKTQPKKSTKAYRMDFRQSAKKTASVRRSNSSSNQAGSSSSPPAPSHTHLHVTTPSQDQRTKTKLLRDSRRKSDTEIRNKDTALLQDLDKERERRWKAEQAAERLVEHVRTLQTKLRDTQTNNELCVVKNSQLATDLKEEMDSASLLKAALEEARTQLESNKDDGVKSRTREEEQMHVLRILEEKCRQFETEKIQERTELVSRAEEAERQATGHQREVELLTKSVRHLKSQLHQTQELLANRERDHQREMENCKPLGHKELQEIISKEVQCERTKMDALIEQYKDKITEQQKAYNSLEDEFRMALRIETGRFQELHRTYEQVSTEVVSSRETAIAAVQKEQKANGMIMELTALAKEQKGRIVELGRSKQEVLTQMKERIAAFEIELSTKNKLELKLQSLQEENGRLLSKVQAQDSLIEGLREERQLWSKELAHQGATLAQDRGRMEAQVDGLSEEVKTTREQLQREREAVRIKEKQIEDQLQTIHRLKQTLSDKEHEVQSQQLDWQREQQSLHLQLEQEQAENQELQEQVSGIVERKESLKQELAECQERLEQWKIKYNKLKVQWDEKVKILSSLEENMGKLQQTFAQREASLVQEKDLALEDARTYQQRLKSCDDAFREQLEAKQRSHDNHMTRLLTEKDREIQQANQKVASVENEMREVLTDVAREKKNMETRFQKLSKAFQELRLDISD